MARLDNPKHERFAQLVATGKALGPAYREVYGDIRGARQAGSRLLSDVDIKQRVAEIQSKSEGKAVLTIAEKREFLRRVVVTPIGQVDEESDLCQSAEYSDTGRKFKMPDKLKAIELDAKLAGEFTEKVEVKADGLLELLQAIRGGKPA